MPADPVRRALEAAAKAAQTSIAAEPCIDQGGVCQMPPYPCTCALAIASAAVAAFLRALPERFPMPGQHNPDCQVWGHAKGEMRKLAAAVERAARGGEGAG